MSESVARGILPAVKTMYPWLFFVKFCVILKTKKKIVERKLFIHIAHVSGIKYKLTHYLIQNYSPHEQCSLNITESKKASSISSSY